MPAVTIPSPAKDVKEELQISPTAAPPSAERPITSDYFDHKRSRSRSSSPERPPVSPITPVASETDLVGLAGKFEKPAIPPTEFIPHPKPEPIKDWNENEDVLALRSAISLLQMQRDKAKKDIRTLEQVKQSAIAKSDEYVEEVKARRKATPKPRQTLSDILRPVDAETLAPTLSDEEESDEGKEAGGRTERADSGAGTSSSSSKFQAAPQPQNIVRCPPINWAKYHVLGDTLEKMHAEQKARPNFDSSNGINRADPHHIAAPYSPFTDRISRPGNSPTNAPKKGTKKPNS